MKDSRQLDPRRISNGCQFIQGRWDQRTRERRKQAAQTKIQELTRLLKIAQ